MNRGRAIASASSGAIAILCWVVFGSIANSQLATGSIVDEDGKAISNVELTPSLFEPNLSIADRKKVATTNASGHWEWDISENASVYCLRAFKPGYAPHEIPIVAGPQVTKLTAASSVQGYVVDSNDREVEGAHVSLVENGPGFSAQPALRTVSDNRGWFELFGVHDNNINLRAWNPSGEAGYLNNVSTAGTKPIVIELLKPKPLEFQVVDEKANPIAGATITLRSWNKTGVFQWSSKSDNRGIATWNDAPVGVLAFDVEREGYSRVWKHIQNWESQRQRIAMRLAGAERCNVVDHDTGAPIDRFVVLYSGEKASALSVPAQELVGWHSVSSLPMDAVIVKNGVLPLDSIPFFDAMDVEVIAIGYSRFKFRLDKHMDLATTPEFRLKQPNVISNAKCKLVDWNGNAVRGAIVMYIAQGGITVSRQSDPIATQLQWPYHVYQHTTDQLGEFRLNARPEFEFVSAWNETGSYTGLSRRLAPDATIQLEPYARLAVRTSIKNYGPFRKLSVQHSIHLDPDKSYAKAHFFTPLEFDQETGLWVSDRIPPGEVSVVCQTFDPNSKKFSEQVLASARIEPSARRSMDLAGDCSIRGRLNFQVASLNGTTKVECVAISRDLKSGEMKYYRSMASEDGSFQIQSLPVGSYLMEFVPRSSQDKRIRTGQYPSKLFCDQKGAIKTEPGKETDVGSVEIRVAE